MKEIHFNPDEFPKLAVLIKEAACFYDQLKKHYVDHFTVPTVALSLEYGPNNKVTAKDAKEYLNHILPILKENDIHTLYVADAAYFKVLTKKQKTEPYYGYVLPCAIDGFDELKVIYGVNYQALFHNPALSTKLALSISTVNDYMNDSYQELGLGIIHSANYPTDILEIVKQLKELHKYPTLTCDIETLGLDLEDAIPVTITFCWDEHNGTAFEIEDPAVKQKVVEFFKTYQGELIYHNATFDIRCIIYHMFMSNPLDYKGLVDALDVMYRNTHDTKVIAYLCLNSTADVSLSLKQLAFEFAGNYAIDGIGDITQYPIEQVLEYNLIDGLSTFHVFNKYYPMLVKENQLDIYNNLFVPALKNITHMELIGMPMSMDTVTALENLMHKKSVQFEHILDNAEYVKDTKWQIQKEKFIEANLKYKRKIKSLDDFAEPLNYGSNKQLVKLVYETMELPVLDTTDTGGPSTSSSALKKHIAHLKQQYGVTDEDLQEPRGLFK